MQCYKVSANNCVGLPDRLVTLPNGRCCWVELKTDHGKLSLVQQLRHKELRKAGQDVRVVWNKDEADRFVEEVGNILGSDEEESSLNPDA